ncbi:MAG: hypothetical protein ABIK15_03890 [Pseudomonadota bacterium]
MRNEHFSSLTSHGRTLFQIVAAPGKFFEDRRQHPYLFSSGAFLIISALLFTAASLVFQRPPSLLITGAILLGNALGMVMILSFISYLVMVLSIGKKASFRQIFSIFAYASGTSLMAAWIPHLLIVSEPWRWCLIGIGLTRGCGLKWMGSIWIMVCSITVTTLLLQSILLMVHA